MTEKRSFGMHPNLLYDVIMRQAGTLQKAILEGVMNAIDAGATRCDVIMETDRFVVEDNGHGFQSRQEIEDFFETFGTPHQEGDAVYGRFRMGRGQMMAFGRNLWRSRRFAMDVDVKKKGLDYILSEHDEDFRGTRIEAILYEQMMPSELERNKNELRKFVAWAQIPVTLNGEVISQQPENGKWTHQDDDAWYALSQDRQMMSVYNLGVLVNQFPAGRFGMGGTIVTKRQIEVNFARNDVQSTCPVFRRIQNHIKKASGTAAQKKTKLTDAERDLLVREFLAGEIESHEVAKLRVLTCVHGRTWPLNKLNQIPSQFGGKLALGERGDLMLETAQNRKIAFALDQGTLERFGVSDLDGFLARVQGACEHLARSTRAKGRSPDWTMMQMLHVFQMKQITTVSRNDLRAFVSDEHIALPVTELNAGERILRSALDSAYAELVYALNTIKHEDIEHKRRKLHLGRSQTAYAWTDGLNNVWVDMDHAKQLLKGPKGAYQVALTLLHEALHTGPDTGTHEHDHAFYKAFHDLAGHPHDPVGRTTDRMITQFTSMMRSQGKKVSKAMLGLDDAQTLMETTLSRLKDVDA